MLNIAGAEDAPVPAAISPAADVHLVAASLEAAHQALQTSRALSAYRASSHRGGSFDQGQVMRSEAQSPPLLQTSMRVHMQRKSSTEQSKDMTTHSLALGDERACPVCLSALARAQVKSCGHQVCITCARAICQAGSAAPTCPLCRTYIDVFVQGTW